MESRQTPLITWKQNKPRDKRETMIFKRSTDESDTNNESETMTDDSDSDVNDIAGSNYPKTSLALVTYALVGIAISVLAFMHFRGQRKQQELDAYLNNVIVTRQAASARGTLHSFRATLFLTMLVAIVGIFTFQKRYYDRLERSEYNKRIQARWLTVTIGAFIFIIGYFATANPVVTEDNSVVKSRHKIIMLRYLPFVIGLALAYCIRDIIKYLKPESAKGTTQQPLRFGQLVKGSTSMPLGFVEHSSPSKFRTIDNRYNKPQISRPIEQPRHFLIPTNERLVEVRGKDFINDNPDRFKMRKKHHQRQRKRRKRKRHKKPNSKHSRGDDGYNGKCTLRHQHCGRGQSISQVYPQRVYRCDVSGGRYYEYDR